MATRKCGAKIYDGGDLIGTVANRPVRLMPNGYAGVVYDGTVRPLYRGNSIQLQDQPVDRSLCNRFVSYGSAIPYAPGEGAVRLSDSDAGSRDLRKEHDGGPDPKDLGVELVELADALVAASDETVDQDDAVSCVEAFLRDPDGSYLAWRLVDASTRPGRADDGSVDSRLRLMASIIRDDGELLERLQAAYGLFLRTRPHLARRAINAEFDKIDLDDAWWSPDAALRRARASVTFPRHAVVLAFGTEDPGDQVPRMLSELTPPADEHFRNAPPSVLAELVKLRRMLTLVEGLFFGQHADVKTIVEAGRAELFAVERGDYNALAALASDRSAKSNNLSGEGLPFVVLPPGEQLQSFIDELHRNNGTYLDRVVDIDRVGVLTRLGKYLRDRGYSYQIRRGAFPSSHNNDNGYVVLTFTRRGSSEEDAVTISPWKGEHATFVVRHDCGERLPWHAVLSRTKREAKELGAERLVFKSKTSHHIDVYEAMLQKITALLECDRHEFDCGETYFDYAQRRHRVRIPDDAVGSGVFEDKRDSGPRVEPHRNESPSVIEQVATWFRRLF